MTTSILESYYDVGRSSQVGISNSDQYCCGSSWPVLPHIFAYCVHVVYTSIIFCYIIPNLFTLQQLPPWLSGKASHLYQLDMRRSLVRFGQVANFFFAFFEVWTIFEYLPFLSCSFCFCFQLSPSTIVNAYSKFLLFTFAMRRSSENERHIAVLRVGTYSVDILTYTFWCCVIRFALDLSIYLLFLHFVVRHMPKHLVNYVFLCY